MKESQYLYIFGQVFEALNVEASVMLYNTDRRWYDTYDNVIFYWFK